MDIPNIKLEVTQVSIKTDPKILINGQSIPIDYPTSNQLHMLECIAQELAFEKRNKPHIAWQIVRSLFHALTTEFPTFIHFAIAREALSDEDTDINNKPIDPEGYKLLVIQVASLIPEHCKRLQDYLTPQAIKKILFLIEAKANKFDKKQHVEITDFTEAFPEIDNAFLGEPLFTIDELFLRYLACVGKNGVKIAASMRAGLAKQRTLFQQTEKYPLSFYFNAKPSPERPSFISFALISLAKAIWRDEVSHRARMITRGVTTLIENDQKPIVALLSRNKEIIEPTDQTNYYQVTHSGSPLGIVPMIPEDLMNLVLKGINKLALVEGHRVLRYILRTIFTQWVDGETDHRVIKRESFQEIAAEMGLKNTKNSATNIIEVLHAMAHFEFKTQNFKGNLITIKKTFSPKTSRQDSVEITVGTALLPYRSCENFKNGESKLMIPLLPDPPLVGANQYHAGQFLLQMLVMAEFARKSITVAKHGYAYIDTETWEAMAQDCGVLPILDRILDRWTKDGPDGPRILEKKGDDCYALGKAYQKEASLLAEQGALRVYQSKRAKRKKQKKGAEKAC
jgi:hypothetical protein